MCTWENIKKLLKQKILPTYYVQENFAKLHNIQQGREVLKSMQGSSNHFLMKCELQEDEPQSHVRLLGGLDSKIANVVELHHYSTLEELVILAHKVDKQQNTKGKWDSSRLFAKTTHYTKPNTFTPKPTTHTTSKPPFQKPTKIPYK